MADELQPAYLIAGSDRPKVDRAVARLRGSLRARRGRAARRRRLERRRRSRRLQRDGALRLRQPARRLRGRRGLEAARREGDRGVPQVARTRDDPRARRPTSCARTRRSRRRSAGARRCSSGTCSSRAVPKWIAEQFKLSGVTVEPEACRLLADLVGEDLYELASEIEKLVTWAAGAGLTAADVETLVAPRADSPPWNLTDAWGARDVEGVLRAAERMLDRTGDPVSKTIPRLVG